MDEATTRRVKEELLLRKFLEDNQGDYAHTFAYISPENLEEFQRFFTELLLEPSFNGYTSISIKH